MDLKKLWSIVGLERKALQHQLEPAHTLILGLKNYNSIIKPLVAVGWGAHHMPVADELAHISIRLARVPVPNETDGMRMTLALAYGVPPMVWISYVTMPIDHTSDFSDVTPLISACTDHQSPNTHSARTHNTCTPQAPSTAPAALPLPASGSLHCSDTS